MLWILHFTTNAQQVDATYLNPMLNDTRYRFIRFGTSAEHYAGFMYNISSPTYGNDGSFSIFTYSNRDMVLRTGTGNVIINHESSGKLGIGTSNPQYKLHVLGDVYLQGNTTAPGGTWSTTFLYWKGHSLIMGTPVGRYAHNRLELKPGGSANGLLYSNLQLYNALNENSHQLAVNITSQGVSYFNGGNVGIGTDNPGTHKLAVNGTIRAKEILVEASPWPDYVFEEDYNLMDLTNLKSYIEQNKHLPEIPSADQVAAEGVSLGEMDRLLLQKIEELTLYIIQQQEQIKEQQERIKVLEAK
ncbi:hypothetical protein QWY31_16320 [Cytophagales bacterium LB-30]|uniref:Tail fiber domain-containing protein n=1 Tax=Shiella aurantiaca TaxID=3058365 RepID=A0ABT8F9C9_9BACT|nr:hypothetical protein [Shiella aurantiaca]MDN4167077.1 hypothetical protein [Shiella aurantiaca]